MVENQPRQISFQEIEAIKNEHTGNAFHTLSNWSTNNLSLLYFSKTGMLEIHFGNQGRVGLVDLVNGFIHDESLVQTPEPQPLVKDVLALAQAVCGFSQV